MARDGRGRLVPSREQSPSVESAPLSDIDEKRHLRALTSARQIERFSGIARQARLDVSTVAYHAHGNAVAAQAAHDAESPVIAAQDDGARAVRSELPSLHPLRRATLRIGQNAQLAHSFPGDGTGPPSGNEARPDDEAEERAEASCAGCADEVKSGYGRLEPGAERRIPICLLNGGEQLRREEGVASKVHPIPGREQDVIGHACTSVGKL